MSNRRLAKGIALLAMVLGVLLLPASAQAQVTTGSIGGKVVAASDDSPLPGVTVTIVHVPTNTTYTTTTGANGEFQQPNTKPGGPYTVRFEMDSFQTAERTDVRVGLGQTTWVEIDLSMQTITEEITVTDTASDLINPSRTGSQSELAFEEIQAYPTVRRNVLLDGAKTNPYASIRASDEAQKDISFAGRSSKYNNIQIDGSNYNDLFGLGESGGTPAGQSNAQPIQQDVVQELQVAVSPYDVRQGGFTGGTINAVTRSGSNDFHGSLYYAQRDPDYVGDGPFDTAIKDFDEEQYGASLGGYILKDKLWFFGAYENNERSEASGFSADGSTGQQYGKPADAQRFQDILQTKYGYDAGGLGDIPIAT
ncbi:MAG TPA: TonB-dependent receptor, partial [Thermoanaerobaculia bacterium]|nr:TonB-dependent receptor [Thermoanaerobaculia bacterium]